MSRVAKIEARNKKVELDKAWKRVILPFKVGNTLKGRYNATKYIITSNLKGDRYGYRILR